MRALPCLRAEYNADRAEYRELQHSRQWKWKLSVMSLSTGHASPPDRKAVPETAGKVPHCVDWWIDSLHQKLFIKTLSSRGGGGQGQHTWQGGRSIPGHQHHIRSEGPRRNCWALEQSYRLWAWHWSWLERHYTPFNATKIMDIYAKMKLTSSDDTGYSD